MAQTDRFYIGLNNKDSGMDSSLKPFLIPDSAFQTLNNAYVFRGRVRKRFGSRLMQGTTAPTPGYEQLQSRLRIELGTTNGTTGNLTVFVPNLSSGGNHSPYSTPAIGQMFSVGNDVFTVNALGSPTIVTLESGNVVRTTSATGSATGTLPGGKGLAGQKFTIGTQLFTVPGGGGALTTGGPGSGTLVLATGVFTFTGCGVNSSILWYSSGGITYNTTSTATATSGQVIVTGAQVGAPVFFYPALPVMGLVTLQTTVNLDETVVAFDTMFAYQYTTTGWARLGTAVWSGSNSDFFWGANWNGILRSDYYLFVTNFIENDSIKYFGGSSTSNDWVSMSPIVNNTDRIHTARIVLPFKDRLIMLNTVEYNDAEADLSNPYGPTNAMTGDLTVPAVNVPAGGFQIGQNFVVGTTILTINDVTTNADVDMIVATVNATGAKATAKFNGTTGKLTLLGNNTNRNQGVYFLPNLAAGSSVKYQNRCRYSVNGSPVNTNSFLEVAGGGGGYVDCPVKEAIITAQFLRDRLIVYFEQSTWELAYTGNQIAPFVWQQINTEFGAESTFSQVPFDKVVLGVGNVGIVACTGSSVERIDDKIPDEVFDIHNDNGGIKRIYGIRDYYVEMVYWSFPDATRSSTFPFNNKILVYNYKTGAWAFNDDSITAFGYFQSSANEGETWQSNNLTWETEGATWTDGPNIQALFRNVIGGNQEGYTFIIDPDDDRNSPALQITDMQVTDAITVTITCINHNLAEGFNGIGDYIAIENVQGLTGVTNMIFPVNSVIDANTFTILVDNGSVSGTYTGGGTIARVSNIDIVSKQYNFYMQDGCDAAINKIDFLVDRTTSGQVTVDYFVSSSGVSTLLGGTQTGSLLGNGTLETSPYALIPLESSQSRLWHSVYPMVNGECIQINLYMTDEQLRNPEIAFSGFELHAILFFATRTSSRFE